MPNRETQMLDVIQAFYEAAYDASLWPTAWASTVKFFNGETGMLIGSQVGGEAEKQTPLAMPGFSPHALGLFGEHYATQDPYAADGRRNPGRGPRLGQEIIAPEDFRNSELWYDFSRTYLGAFHVVGEVLLLGGDQVALAGIHRPEDGQQFDEEDRQRCQLLFPHLRHALQIGERLGVERGSHDLLSRLLDGLTDGALLTDSEGHVLYTNKMAEVIAGPGSGIVLGDRASGLHVLDAALNSKFGKMIRSAARGGSGGHLILPSLSVGAGITVQIGPVPRSRLERSGLSGTCDLALVILRKLSPRLPISEAALQERFGLSAAEASVTRSLVDGASADVIARARNVSLTTVRTQIRNILGKTGAANLRLLTLVIMRG